MRTVLLLALVATGCAGLECGEGTEEADGVCVAQVDDDVATITDVLDTLAPCESVSANGRVDIDAGCADGACASMTKAQIDAALSSTATCESSVDPTSLLCTWPNGVWASFEDLDEDHVADPASTAGTLFLEDPYDGSTEDGLGVGASLWCFVDVLGYPNAVDFWDLSGKLEPASMSWFDPLVFVSDFFATGAADTIGLSGGG